MEGAVEAWMGEEFDFPVLAVCEVSGWVGGLGVCPEVKSDFS